MVVVSSNFSAPVEGVLLESPSTKLVVEGQEIGTATLYITESNVVWGGGVRAAGGVSPTVTLLYPSISIHAIQREPFPALYMVLNYDLSAELMPQSQSQDDSDFDAEDQPISQIRFVPQNENDVQAMFSAMSQGQALHPDPADEVDDDDPYMDGEEFDEGDDEFEDAEESSTPDARLRQLRIDNSNGAQNHQDAEDEDINED